MMRSESSGTNTKSWWAPLWRGLVADSTAKHYRSMKSAIWLFLYFVLHADRKTGRLIRRYDTMAKETGFAKRTIRHWLSILKQHGYVEVERSGGSLAIIIRVQKWKPLLPRSQMPQTPTK
jgi:DNA-binding transcriptional ArsR family regulator